MAKLYRIVILCLQKTVMSEMVGKGIKDVQARRPLGHIYEWLNKSHALGLAYQQDSVCGLMEIGNM